MVRSNTNGEGTIFIFWKDTTCVSKHPIAFQILPEVEVCLDFELTPFHLFLPFLFGILLHVFNFLYQRGMKSRSTRLEMEADQQKRRDP